MDFFKELGKKAGDIAGEALKNAIPAITETATKIITEKISGPSKPASQSKTEKK